LAAENTKNAKKKLSRFLVFLAADPFFEGGAEGRWRPRQRPEAS
jgi:hypothetical protein